MFGIDPYVLETLIPSLFGIACISGAMFWAFLKIRSLMNADKADK